MSNLFRSAAYATQNLAIKRTQQAIELEAVIESLRDALDDLPKSERTKDHPIRKEINRLSTQLAELERDAHHYTEQYKVAIELY